MVILVENDYSSVWTFEYEITTDDVRQQLEALDKIIKCGYDYLIIANVFNDDNYYLKGFLEFEDLISLRELNERLPEKTKIVKIEYSEELITQITNDLKKEEVNYEYPIDSIDEQNFIKNRIIRTLFIIHAQEDIWISIERFRYMDEHMICKLIKLYSERTSEMFDLLKFNIRIKHGETEKYIYFTINANGVVKMYDSFGDKYIKKLTELSKTIEELKRILQEHPGNKLLSYKILYTNEESFKRFRKLEANRKYLNSNRGREIKSQLNKKYYREKLRRNNREMDEIEYHPENNDNDNDNNI